MRGLVLPSKHDRPGLGALALVAAHYAESGAAGVDDAEIAQVMGRSATQIRDDVYAARREGLLSEVRAGPRRWQPHGEGA
ncbi:MAG: hypothetical protein U0667_18500 [Chloroflexota bacterium]